MSDIITLPTGSPDLAQIGSPEWASNITEDQAPYLWRLAEEIVKARKSGPYFFRLGRVQAISTTTATISCYLDGVAAGLTTGIQYLQSVSPVVNDAVMILCQGDGSMLAIGSLNTVGVTMGTGRLIAYKMGTASGQQINFNQVSNATPLHIMNINMIAGHMYRLQYTFRAIQSTTGMYVKLQRGGVDYSNFDYYIGAGTGTGTWTSANIEWLIPGSGSGNAGVNSWRINCWHLGASGTAPVYNDGGGFCAAYDLGNDPGAQ